MKVLVLFDLGEEPPYDQDYSEFLKREDSETENDVVEALKKLDHEVRPFGLYNDIALLANEVKQNRPDIVFNLCESFQNNRDLEPHIVSMLELFEIPYTGCGPTALLFCKDKGLSKQLLTPHRIKVPRFRISSKSYPIKKMGKFPYPAIVKPLDFEGSEGINTMSYVENETDCIDRIQFIHTKLESDVIVEEYIEGRELYVGVMGNERLSTFPPWEMVFTEVPENEPKFATFRAKWDEQYRKKWGIKNQAAKSLSPEILTQIDRMCKRVFKIFHMRGYGRLDLRLTANNEIYFIEANPNPNIAKEDDFARSAGKTGLNYLEIISKILSLAGGH